MKNKLPIDVIPGSRPIKFRWEQTVDAIVGMRTIPIEGTLPAGVEKVVADLIAMTKKLMAENEELRKPVNKLPNTSTPPTKKGKSP